MQKLKVTVFAISPNYYGYKFEDDMSKIHKYYETHGYGFMLTFSNELQELVNELRAIKRVIDILSEWQNEDFFKLNKTVYEIDWFDCPKNRKEKGKTKVTLTQARKLYENTKAKYDLLIGIIQETFKIHNKDYKGNEYCVDEFLSEIEI